MIAAALRTAPGWKPTVRRRMSLLLDLSGPTLDQAVDRYFSRLADLIAYSAVVSRGGVHAPALAGQWSHGFGVLDDLKGCLAPGRGALLVCPHLCGHEIMAATLCPEFPLTYLVRRSPDEAYEAIKQRWYRSLGVEIVYRASQPGGKGGLADAVAVLRSLKSGRILAMTPDLPQRESTGVPVRFFGRPLHVPGGAFYFSLRTGAPLAAAFFHHDGSRYDLRMELIPASPIAGSGPEAIAALAQAWVDRFEGFLREHPEMWQFWLDKRWGRWIDAAGAGRCG